MHPLLEWAEHHKLTVGYWRHSQRKIAVVSMGKRKDPVCCTRCSLKAAGLHIGIRTPASAAWDEEMPWRALTSEAGTWTGRTRATERTQGTVRASSFHDGRAVAGSDALLCHRALH